MLYVSGGRMPYPAYRFVWNRHLDCVDRDPHPETVVTIFVEGQ
jgi:hypothetical protein